MIHQEAASVVTSASATLGAAIDPHNASTSCYFEYGTSAGYGTSVPAPPGIGLGSGKGDVAVSVHLQGLAAGTVYHYRVVALSEVEGEPVTVEGPDQTFTTQGSGTEFSLPDGRSWEMVSPPNKQGAKILSIGFEWGDDIQAAADGGGITYGASAPFVANPAGSTSIDVAQVISTREAPGSWQTSDIDTPHNEGATAVAVGHGAEYKLFSTDLSVGLVEPADDTPLPPLPADAERTLYLREASRRVQSARHLGKRAAGHQIRQLRHRPRSGSPGPVRLCLTGLQRCGVVIGTEVDLRAEAGERRAGAV